MAFTPRFDPPTTLNKYYRHTGYYVGGENGVNECLLIHSNTGAVMPNCVGYTWGRAYEIYGERPTLSKGDASGWWNYNDGHQRSNYPVVGCVACWLGGSYGGHVAMIEAKNSATEFITSNSYYGSKYFVLEYMRLVDNKWRRYRYADNVLISNYSLKTIILLTDQPDPPPPPPPPHPGGVVLGNKIDMLYAIKPLIF